MNSYWDLVFLLNIVSSLTEYYFVRFLTHIAVFVHEIRGDGHGLDLGVLGVGTHLPCTDKIIDKILQLVWLPAQYCDVLALAVIGESRGS